MNTNEDSSEEYFCHSELLADLFVRFQDHLPRQPIPHVEDGDYQPRWLPKIVASLLNQLDAPPRLVAHLTLVHDAAIEIIDGLLNAFPHIKIDAEAIRFGAATHDLGKIKHPNELTGPGNQHEIDGASLLTDLDVPDHLARFTRTHGAWSTESLPLEDLLVALSDAVWKGKRLEELESLIVATIAQSTETEAWETFSQLDGVLEQVASRGDERLAWQSRRG